MCWSGEKSIENVEKSIENVLKNRRKKHVHCEHPSSAVNELKKLPSNVQDRVRYAIEEFKENPRHGCVEKLTASRNLKNITSDWMTSEI